MAFDLTIMFDPFLPPIIARSHRGCNDGRLFVERISADIRRVWCDGCNWSQSYSERGPLPAIEPRHESADPFNKKPVRQTPTTPERIDAMERALKPCPKCGEQVKILKRATGWCPSCTRKGDRAVVVPDKPLIDPDGDAASAVTALLNRSKRLRDLAEQVAAELGIKIPA